MEIVKYLRSGKGVSDLVTDLAIKVSHHPTMPLCIVNYDQINSPKLHPVVRECRGLVLRRDTGAVVSRSFARFFNWGEVQDEMAQFDFSDCVVQSKEDGSLVNFFWHADEWHVTMRGAFGFDNLNESGMSWRDGILKAINLPSLQHLDAILDRRFTYTGEFCSTWNKIVRQYVNPCVYHLTMFRGEEELSWADADALRPPIFQPVPRHDFCSIEQVQVYLSERQVYDPTFEGVVLRDRNNQRWKVKSPSYLGLHRLKGEDNIFRPKNLLPFILDGNKAELLTCFPEALAAFGEANARVETAYARLEQVWRKNNGIENQKQYALAIAGQTKFAGLLFGLRKRYGHVQTEEQFKLAWRSSGELILKTLF